MIESEQMRLQEAYENTKPWYRWGPYLSERQWGTVREDYSADGDAWDYLPHDHARSRVYRWGEDGLLGMCDDQGQMCFGLALWNEADPILKERLFGLTNAEGNHGEDVKEYYFFLDNTPTHSYMKALYKYPQRAFPYNDLVETNHNRSREEPEYELIDTGVFAENRYFDVTVEYAKTDPLDIMIRISVTNHGPGAAPLHLLPTLWFRNTWEWGYDDRKPILTAIKPEPVQAGSEHDARVIHAQLHDLGGYWFVCQGAPELLFTENESNAERLWGVESRTPFVKDGIHETIVKGVLGKVNPQGVGTKVAAHYAWHVEAGETQAVLLRLSANQQETPFADAVELFDLRIKEADAFYDALCIAQSDDSKAVLRQAFAGLLWSKQFYMYDVEKWLHGDPAEPSPPPQRHRNTGWRHLNAADIIIMPDTWEYPWFAAWDLAYHCITMGLIDMDFAKKQILLLLHEWYMHPNGQLPAYEWSFSDVNPPVHAWSAWHLYKRDKTTTGKGDFEFLESVFHRLLINFTWWVNRKDAEDNNIFEGGFLGLDNIGAFDRNMLLPDSMVLEQSDGTAWMGLYCLTMLRMAMELATVNRAYVDMATKFFEHFMYIADAINGTVTGDTGLWNEEDQFFYDRISIPDNGGKRPLKLRTLVGFIPLLAVEPFQREILDALPELNERLQWFMKNRPYLPHLIATWRDVKGDEEQEFRMLALVRGARLKGILRWMLDPQEFLSDYGIRSLSKHYAAQPYELHTQYGDFIVKYDPAESSTGAFGGNSNWRGPVWFPINYMLVEALEKYYQFYGDELQVEDPTGSSTQLNLEQVAIELSRRLTSIFLRDAQGHRPVFGSNLTFQNDPYWRDCLAFYEYYHGDNGRGVGASHQTGWTALVANLLERTWKTEAL
jgi:Mannosylglycerate hydrolase MGH1-like glycoside hydrolase domain/Glycosyl hydrolase family 63 C-terminal domain